MNLSTLRKRSAATALLLSVSVLGAACAADGDDDATSVGQEESSDAASETTDDAATDAEGTDETASDAEGTTDSAAGSQTARVGATYSDNVFTLIGTDATEDGKIIAITDGSVDVRTSNTISYDGEVVDFTDPKVQEALDEEQYEALKPDLEQGQVLLVDTYAVQE